MVEKPLKTYNTKDKSKTVERGREMQKDSGNKWGRVRERGRRRSK